MGYGVIGNTTDSDSVIPGSSPGTPANHKKKYAQNYQVFFIPIAGSEGSVSFVCGIVSDGGKNNSIQVFLTARD